jgi:hypothetical protein
MNPIETYPSVEMDIAIPDDRSRMPLAAPDAHNKPHHRVC